MALPPVPPSLIFLAVVLLLAATALHKGQMALPTWPTLVLYAALLVLAVAATFLLLRRPARPKLSTAWQAFPVAGRRLATARSQHRPTVFLTLSVATSQIPTGSHVVLRLPDGDGNLVERKVRSTASTTCTPWYCPLPPSLYTTTHHCTPPPYALHP